MTRTLALLAAGLVALAGAAEAQVDDPPPAELNCNTSGPICGGYGACEPYLFADARCVCRCAGDDLWSQDVRCCLWEMRKKDRDPDFAHAVCWGGATLHTGTFPAGRLAACIGLCATKGNACTSDDPIDLGPCRELPEDLPSLLRGLDCTADLKTKHCAMAKIRDSYGAPALLQALRREGACVRAEAAHGLMVYDAPRVRAALVGAAGDRDAHVRMWVAFSLGEVGDEAALPVLAELAKDPEDFVATMATESIRKIENRK